MNVNLKKLAHEIRQATGLPMVALRANLETSEPEFEFEGGYTLQIADCVLDGPYILMSRRGGDLSRIGEFRTQKELIDFIRLELAK